MRSIFPKLVTIDTPSGGMWKLWYCRRYGSGCVSGMVVRRPVRGSVRLYTFCQLGAMYNAHMALLFLMNLNGLIQCKIAALMGVPPGMRRWHAT